MHILETNLGNNIVIPESLATAKEGTCLVPVDTTNVEIYFSEYLPVLPALDSDIRHPERAKHGTRDMKELICYKKGKAIVVVRTESWARLVKIAQYQ